MLGDLEKRAIAESMVHVPLSTRAMININNIPLKKNDCPSDNKGDIRYTKFNYFIKFKPSPSEKFKGKNFVLVADVLPGTKIRFTNYDVLLLIAKENKHLKWILDNTDLCRELVNLAGENLDLPIYLNFDQLKYSNKLKKQIYIETGVWPKYSMFREPNEVMANIARYEAWIETRKKGASKQLDS